MVRWSVPGFLQVSNEFISIYEVCKYLNNTLVFNCSMCKFFTNCHEKQDSDGATLIVTAKFTVVGSRNIALQFEEVSFCYLDKNLSHILLDFLSVTDYLCVLFI